MTEYKSNTHLGELVKRLSQAKRVLVTTHAKPDGDAFGSSIALGRFLQMRHKDVTILHMPPVPDAFDDIKGRDLVHVYQPGDKLPDVDVIAITDTGAYAQVDPIADEIRSRLDQTIVLDHHLSGDIEASQLYIDNTAAGAAEVIADCIDAYDAYTGDPPAISDPVIGECLYLGIASDTGWFRFPNTSPRTHTLAARLIASGIQPADIFAKTEQTERIEKIRLMARGLDSLRLFEQGRAAIMVLRGEDFAQTGARAEETERLIDLPRSVATVEVVALVSQPPVNGSAPDPSDPVRLSFRSSHGDGAVNVAELAAAFGGGGHARAAGARTDGPIETAVEHVIEHVQELLRDG